MNEAAEPVTSYRLRLAGYRQRRGKGLQVTRCKLQVTGRGERTVAGYGLRVRKCYMLCVPAGCFLPGCCALSLQVLRYGMLPYRMARYRGRNPLTTEWVQKAGRVIHSRARSQSGPGAWPHYFFRSKFPSSSASISSIVGRLDLNSSGRDLVISLCHWATPIGFL